MAPSATAQKTGPEDPLPSFKAKPPEDLVIPPAQIRGILEKIAGYVDRNGKAFEKRILDKETNNPKFSFLKDGDAYRPYFDWRLSEIRAGRSTDMAAGRPGEGATAIAQQQRQAEKKGPEKPPDFQFSAKMPNINAQDLDVVKLTALFVAKNGRTFQTTLSQKERENYQFQFLHQHHSLNPYFSRLVDQYSLLLGARGTDGAKEEQKRVAELQRNIDDKFHVLARAKQRAEWDKHQARQKVEKTDKEEKDSIAYAQIDWHDFTIVETVVFTEADDEAELAPPPNLNDLQSASLEQKAMMSVSGPGRRIEEAMPTDDMDISYDTPAQAQPQANGYAHQVPQNQPYPQPTPSPIGMPLRASNSPLPPPPANNSMVPPPPTLGYDRAGERDAANDAAARARAAANPANAPLNIRHDYAGRTGRPGANARVATSKCPRCNQQIPNTQWEEHVKIELLDPRWREQRDKEAARQSTTNLSTADVARNLKRLASQRSDVFEGSGATGEEVDEAERDRRKRAARGYDGVIPGLVGHGPVGKGGTPGVQQPSMPGAPGQGLSVEEQIKHIRQKAQQS